MGKIAHKLLGIAAGIYFKCTGSALNQKMNAEAFGGEVRAETSAILRRAAAEGAVLLENDGMLPLAGKIALFGRAQTDTFYTGYGSGGNVIAPYRVSILQGLRAALPLCEELSAAYEKFSAAHPLDYGGWGEWPRSAPEMPLKEELIRAARAETETAVVVLGRAAGEDCEHTLEEGSFYLTKEERRMLSLVTGAFPHVAVVLDAGNVIDLSWTKEYPIGALLLAFQGGMEAGNAVADVLTGKTEPSGRLADTIAFRYGQYPARNFGGKAFNEYTEDIFLGYRHFETFAKEDVLYPFGYGLGYTRFSVRAEYEDGAIKFCVKNVGGRAGREVVQAYVQKPQGTLGAPARELVGFYKTGRLAPGEEERGEILLPPRAFCVYDEARSAFVMPAGVYALYVGGDVRRASLSGTFSCEKERVVERLTRLGAPQRALEVRAADGGTRRAEPKNGDMGAEIFRDLPAELPKGGKIPFRDVIEGAASAEQFAASLSDREAEALAYGALKMNSPLGADGNAGVFGGVSPSLRARGVPPVTATDGPSGIRLKKRSALLPIGTLLACTFDVALAEQVYACVGREMRERGSDVLLAPAMNLHRNPLCGRNFEYFSEDPYLTGKIAAAAVRGVQSAGVSACPKHFACNNQEFGRNGNDSRLSERALRELYLYGFEICVKEGKPRFLMTSYNKVNGVLSSYNAELVRGILRGEWGFGGCVITDWWMKRARCPENAKLKNNAYRVHAGVNVLMPGGGYLGKRKQHGGLLRGLGRGRLTRGELQRNACETLRAIAETFRGRE